MPLETGDYISDLVETNPLGIDNVSQGDDHLRLIKHVLKTTFPNINGPVTSSDEDLSNLGGGMPMVTTYITPATAQTHTFGVGKNWYRVYVTGGGGGGGASAGGAAGGTAIKAAQITSASLTYTIGSGGAAGADGETSSIDDGTVAVSATGGENGNNATSASPWDGIVEGGSGVGGDTNIIGGGPTSQYRGAGGGGSYWGGGNAGEHSAATCAYGTGGKGDGGNALAARAGNPGVIVIEEY